MPSPPPPSPLPPSSQLPSPLPPSQRLPNPPASSPLSTTPPLSAAETMTTTKPTNDDIGGIYDSCDDYNYDSDPADDI